MRTQSVLCVGIDPSAESLRSWGLPNSADGALEMGRAILEGCVGRVGIVKPQIGYFERFGSAGFVALETVFRDARGVGLEIIADVKRGDIGSTMEGYADAWLGDGALGSSAMTASPYQGFDALEPAFSRAESRGATVFVLAATSNPDATDIQGVATNDESLPARIARFARHRSGASHTVGVVVGATRTLAQSGLTEKDLDGLLVLAPGFGAQGARLGELRDVFGSVAPNVIPSVSRSVLNEGPNRVAARIDAHLMELAV